MGTTPHSTMKKTASTETFCVSEQLVDGYITVWNSNMTLEISRIIRRISRDLFISYPSLTESGFGLITTTERLDNDSLIVVKMIMEPEPCLIGNALGRLFQSQIYINGKTFSCAHFLKYPLKHKVPNDLLRLNEKEKRELLISVINN